MKIKNLVFGGIFICGIIAGCNDAPKTVTEKIEETVPSVNEHTSENSLSWAGVYEGVLPCADCPGIAVKLELDKKGTYHYHSYYMDRKADTMHQEGTFAWKATGSEIILMNNGQPDSTAQYRVIEGALEKLDIEGKRIEGNLAPNYVLKQTKVEEGTK